MQATAMTFLVLGLSVGLYTWSNVHTSGNSKLIAPMLYSLALGLLIYFAASNYLFFSVAKAKTRVWFLIVLITLLTIPSFICYAMAGPNEHFDYMSRIRYDQNFEA